MRKTLPFFLALILSAGCKEKAPEIPVGIVGPTSAIHYDETFQFLVKQGDKELNNRDYSWALPPNTKIGTIDANGLFTAKRIGTVFVKIEKGGTSFGDYSVTIEPYSNLFAEPVLAFGLAKDLVIKDGTRKKVSESETGMIYEGENSSIRNVIYSFKDGKLSSIAVVLQTTTEIATEALVYLKERYSYLGVTDKIYLYEDKGRVSLGITVDASLGLALVYLPYTATKRLSVDNQGIDEVLATLRANTTKQK